GRGAGGGGGERRRGGGTARRPGGTALRPPISRPTPTTPRRGASQASGTRFVPLASSATYSRRPARARSARSAGLESKATQSRTNRGSWAATLGRRGGRPISAASRRYGLVQDGHCARHIGGEPGRVAASQPDVEARRQPVVVDERPLSRGFHPDRGVV